MSKTLPQKAEALRLWSPECEDGLIGSILLDPERVIDICLQKHLTARSFHHPGNRIIFETAVEMLNKNLPIDILTVHDYLERKGLLESAGGMNRLTEVIERTPTAAHAEYFADVVFDKALMRGVRRIAMMIQEKAEETDATGQDLLISAEKMITRLSILQSQSPIEWKRVIDDALIEIETAFETKRPANGLLTGYTDLDDTMQGMAPGDMIIIAARPSMGKTSLALNIAAHLAMPFAPTRKPVPVGIFSLEMSADQVAKRMISSYCSIPYNQLKSGYISKDHLEEVREAAKALRNAPVVINDMAGLDISELRSFARRMKLKHNVAAIFIDYLQLLNDKTHAKEGQQRETSAISCSLKAMAKELHVPVIVLSQLSRAPEIRDKLAIPKLSDLRNSGALEQDADIVCFLRRPCQYQNDPEHDDRQLAIISVAKNRNGPTNPNIRLNFYEEYTKFANRYAQKKKEEDE